MWMYSNMPDPVLELQLSGSQLCGPDAGVNVLTGPDALIRRSAIFVDLFDTARYGTRLIPLKCQFFKYTVSQKMHQFWHAVALTSVDQFS